MENALKDSPAMSQQLSLFDTHNLARNAYYECLKNLEFGGAVTELLKWDHSFCPPDNFQERVKALEKLQTTVSAVNRNDSKQMARLLMELKGMEFLSALTGDLQFVEHGLKLTIAKNWTKSQFSYIIDDIHSAEILVDTENYLQAINAVDSFIRNHGEDSFLRQVQGFAYFHSGREEQALMLLSFALFNNPLRCQEKYLFPDEANGSFAGLREKYGNSHMAWLKLPLMLWQAGKIPVQQRAVFFEKFLKSQIENRETYSSSNGKNLEVLHLLYLVEMLRLRGEKLEEIKKYRVRMKSIDPDFYSLYLSILAQQSIPETERVSKGGRFKKAWQ